MWSILFDGLQALMVLIITIVHLSCGMFHLIDCVSFISRIVVVQFSVWCNSLPNIFFKDSNVISSLYLFLWKHKRIAQCTSETLSPSVSPVVVNPLLPAYWGDSVSVALWGFAASFSRQSSSRAATPEGSLHKSRADSVVRICGQLKRCCVVCSWVRQRGQSGDGCVEASILCRYDRR